MQQLYKRLLANLLISSITIDRHDFHQTGTVCIKIIRRPDNFTKAVQIFFKTRYFKFLFLKPLKIIFSGYYHLNKKYITETMLDIISKRRREIDNTQSYK
jgi:hypothetical protein